MNRKINIDNIYITIKIIETKLDVGEKYYILEEYISLKFFE